MVREEAAFQSSSRDAPWRSQRPQRRSDGTRFAELFQAWGSHEVLSVDDEEDNNQTTRSSRWSQTPAEGANPQWLNRNAPRLRASDPQRYFSHRQRKPLTEPVPNYISLDSGPRSPKEYIPLDSEGREGENGAIVPPAVPVPAKYSRVSVLLGLDHAKEPIAKSPQGFIVRVNEKMRKAIESENAPDGRDDTSSASSMAISHEPLPVIVDPVHTDADESGELPDDEEEDPIRIDFMEEPSEISSDPPPLKPPEEVSCTEIMAPSSPQSATNEIPIQPEEEYEEEDEEEEAADMGVGELMTELEPDVTMEDTRLDLVADPTANERDSMRITESTVPTSNLNPLPATTAIIVDPDPQGSGTEPHKKSRLSRSTLGSRRAKLSKTRKTAAISRKLKKEEDYLKSGPTESLTSKGVLNFEKGEVEKCGLLLRTNLECSCLRNRILELALQYREMRRQEDSLRNDLMPLLRSAGNSTVNSISPQFDTAIKCLLKAVVEPTQVKEERKMKRRRVEQ